MAKLLKLRKWLRPGKVHPREDLAHWSTSVDGHLQQLFDAGDLTKLSNGPYYRPKQTVFGNALAEDDALVQHSRLRGVHGTRSGLSGKFTNSNSCIPTIEC